MIPESGRIPFYVFFFVMIGLCFLPALVFPAGEDARIDLGIRVEELKTARDNIAMDIGVRAEVVAMKKEKGMAYHDNTALKKDLWYMGEQARDTVLLTTQTIAEEDNRQLKSSALQQMLDRVHSVMNE